MPPIGADKSNCSTDDSTLLVRFAKPQRALTPGQICALYDGEVLLGGGVFEEIYHEAEVEEARSGPDRTVS